MPLTFHYIPLLCARQPGRRVLESAALLMLLAGSSPVLPQTGTRRRMVATLRVASWGYCFRTNSRWRAHRAWRRLTCVCVHMVVVVVVVHVETRSEEAGSNKVVWPAAETRMGRRLLGMRCGLTTQRLHNRGPRAVAGSWMYLGFFFPSFCFFRFFTCLWEKS